MPIIQNFSIPAGDTQTIEFDVSSETIEEATLVGATIFWEVYEQQYGQRIPDLSPVIRKLSTHSGDIEILPDSQPLTFYVFIHPSDTEDLLRNYYHEACIYDADKNPIRVTYGIMTVTSTEIRESI